MDPLPCDFGGQDTEQKSPGQCPGLALSMRLCVLQDRYQIRETRETGTQAFMNEGIVDWRGNRYRKKHPYPLMA